MPDQAPRRRRRGDVADDYVERIGAICLALAEVTQSRAWAGVHWQVRTRTFAHVLEAGHGWPPAYGAVAAGDTVTALTFRSVDPEYSALVAHGDPFFCPRWGTRWNPKVAGVLLRGSDDWEEVAELLTESYRLMAPRSLVDRLDADGV